MRIGHGYDVHRLKKGRKCIICGVEIPSEEGLDGHSDADVAVHALMDALLGAASLPDIGVQFPDTDERYAGADSLGLLRRVMELISEKGYKINNADITIIAQRPKLSKYIPLMKKTLADTMIISPDDVNVKATTEEGLGFTGAGEGIAAHAVVLLD